MSENLNDPGRTGPTRTEKSTEIARRLVREAVTATLATLDRGTGHPFASLVSMATAMDGSPVLLLSALARHTRNIAADDRVSLLVANAVAADGDPLSAPRLTVIGRINRDSDPALRRRFILRQPAAATYADFGDFAFYRLDIASAHLVAGFGHIAEIPAADLIENVADAASLAAAEAEIMSRLITEYTRAITSLAVMAGQTADAAWIATGIDPGGLDLMAGTQALRIPFDARAPTPELAFEMVEKLANRKTR